MAFIDRYNSFEGRVEGYSVAGDPWVMGRGGTEGSHVMHVGSRIGTHSDPVMYLWVAFTGS